MMLDGTILITGGCGFIGTSCIAYFIENYPNVKIRVLDNFFNGTPEDLKNVTNFRQINNVNNIDGSHVVLIEGDIRNKEVVDLCTRNVDCIIHLAANTGVGPSVENPYLDMECNVIGTVNMLESARFNGVKKFIFASSGAPIGENSPPIHEEKAPHPVSPYGASKLAGEGYCSAYYNTYGISTVCLRFGNVYGPFSKKKSSVVAKFIRNALNCEDCVIYGDGNQTRDFIYIGDLVQAIKKSIEENVGGEIFQIASGSEMTVREIADLIARSLENYGIDMRIVYDKPRIGDVRRNYSDTTKARELLDWKSDTSIEKGIKSTIEYFINSHHKKTEK